jgi:hypothetical protein
LVNAVALERIALAPADGTVNVTVAPTTGRPFESLTVAWRALGNAAPNRADCGVPPVAVILAAAPVVLVSEKDAESAPTLAVTK